MLIGISGKKNTGKDEVGSIIQYLTTKIIHSYSYQDFINVDILSINETLGSSWKIKKYAAKLKQIVSILLNIPVHMLEREDVKNRVLGPQWDRYKLRYEYMNVKNFERTIYFANEKDMMKHIETETLKNRIRVLEGGLTKITIRILLQEIGTQAMRNMIHPDIWVNSLFEGYEPKCDKYIITDVRFLNEAQAIKDRDGIIIRLERETNTDDQHESEIALDDHYNMFNHVVDNNGNINDLVEKIRIILSEHNLIKSRFV